MALYIYDHGYRIQTPKEGLFKPGGVSSLSRSRHTHRSADVEDKLHADGEKFVIPSQPERKPKTSPDQASKAYSSHTEEPSPENEAAAITVSRIMVSPVHTITEATPAVAAWKRMESLKISHLVVSNDGKKPLGLLSHSDLLEIGSDAIKPIADIYSRQLIAATPETRVQDVAVSFIEHEINAMPVVDHDDNLIGIVCRTDLLRLLVSGPHLERWV
jgi:acetoin utilization protein AcuB